MIGELAIDELMIDELVIEELTIFNWWMYYIFFRYESLVESEEKGYQEQRRRLLQEHQNRIKECEEREAAALLERDRSIKIVQDEYEEKIQVSSKIYFINLFLFYIYPLYFRKYDQ